MAKNSEELAQARKEEIIRVCAQLYETMNFKDVTLKEIGARTSFTRTLIDYYFHTKEEIFLALLQQEYEAWIADLNEICASHQTLTAEQFADELALSLQRRHRLLKLLSMNHYDMEANSRMENLVAFKTAYGNSMRAVRRCLKKFFPQMTASDQQEFIFAFFPFMFGIYPYTVDTEKQKEALKRSHTDYLFLSIRDITRSMVIKLLR